MYADIHLMIKEFAISKKLRLSRILKLLPASLQRTVRAKYIKSTHNKQ